MSEDLGGISGLSITTRPEDTMRVEALVRGVAGVEVRGRDVDRGRLVVVQEQSTVEQHMAVLRSIQQLPGVLSADLVCHFVDPVGDALGDATVDPASS